MAEEKNSSDYLKMRAKIKEQAKNAILNDKVEKLVNRIEKIKGKESKKGEREGYQNPAAILKALKKADKTNREIKKYQRQKAFERGSPREYARRIQFLKNIRANRATQANLQRFAQPRTFQDRWDQITNIDEAPVVNQLAREVFSNAHADREFSGEGDFAARRLNNQADFFANNLINEPSRSVNAETDFFANTLDINPVQSVNNQAWFWANFLDPGNVPQPRRAKRRR